MNRCLCALLLTVSAVTLCSASALADESYDCPPDLCTSADPVDAGEGVDVEPTADVTGDGEPDMTLAEPAPDPVSTPDTGPGVDSELSDSRSQSELSERARYERFLTCGDAQDCEANSELVSVDDFLKSGASLALVGGTRQLTVEALLSQSPAAGAVCSTGYGCAAVAGGLLVAGYAIYDKYATPETEPTPQASDPLEGDTGDTGLSEGEPGPEVTNPDHREQVDLLEADTGSSEDGDPSPDVESSDGTEPPTYDECIKLCQDLAAETRAVNPLTVKPGDPDPDIRMVDLVYGFGGFSRAAECADVMEDYDTPDSKDCGVEIEIMAMLYGGNGVSFLLPD